MCKTKPLIDIVGGRRRLFKFLDDCAASLFTIHVPLHLIVALNAGATSSSFSHWHVHTMRDWPRSNPGKKLFY